MISKISKEFEMQSEVCRSCILSQIFFLPVIDWRTLKDSIDFAVFLQQLAYADGICLLSYSVGLDQIALHLKKNASSDGVKINANKTKIIFAVMSKTSKMSSNLHI